MQNNGGFVKTPTNLNFISDFMSICYIFLTFNRKNKFNLINLQSYKLTLIKKCLQPLLKE